MTPELVFLVVGWVTAAPLVWVVYVAYQWLTDRPERVEIDDYTERLRALDRNPRRVL